MRPRCHTLFLAVLLIHYTTAGCHEKRTVEPRKASRLLRGSPNTRRAELKQMLEDNTKKDRDSRWSFGGIEFHIVASRPIRTTAQCGLYQGGGYFPLPVGDDNFVIHIAPQGLRELRIAIPGYHEWRKRVEIRTGEITTLDPVILEKVAPGTGGRISGIVSLEDGADPSIVKIHADGTPVSVTASGAFLIENLRSGDIYVSASAGRYKRISKKFHLERGEFKNCDFSLLKNEELSCAGHTSHRTIIARSTSASIAGLPYSWTKCLKEFNSARP